MAKKTIILIDDDKFITDMYSEKLQREGFNILSASGGKEGLKLISLYSPDLILLDLVMPRGDGFFVLKEVKKNSSTATMPVIVLTNLSNENDKKEVLRLGADDYLIKIECTPSKIAEKVKALLKV